MKNLRVENGLFQDEKVLVFFGGTADTETILQTRFQNIKFKKIRQTHSDICVASTDTAVEADAHYTEDIASGLLISTADCLPVMIHCEQTGRVAAVHAGWRGIENRITEKTLLKLISTGSSDKKFRFWVGPHIQKDSFEVSEDIYRQLAAAHAGVHEDTYVTQKDDKYYLDLNVLLRSQIENVTQTKADIYFSEDDTKKNAGYFSYRRDQTKLRNLSFIAKLS